MTVQQYIPQNIVTQKKNPEPSLLDLDDVILIKAPEALTKAFSENKQSTLVEDSDEFDDFQCAVSPVASTSDDDKHVEKGISAYKQKVFYYIFGIFII